MMLLRCSANAARRWAGLAEECRGRLAAQQITAAGPGSILTDVNVMLEAIGPAGMASKSHNVTLPPDRLAELNAKSSCPVKLNLRRALLRDYPNLAGIFVLLRVMDLVKAEGKRVVLNPRNLEQWERLNAVERYFSLAGVLLFEARGSVLGGERPRYEPALFKDMGYVLSGLNQRWRTLKSHEVSGFSPMGEMPPWVLFVLRQLGVLELRELPAADRKLAGSSSSGWLPGALRLTPWGEAFAWGLIDYQEREEALTGGEGEDGETEGDLFEGRMETAAQTTEQAADAEDEEEPEVVTGNEIMAGIFQPCFPELKRLFKPAAPEIVPGNRVFKVSLGGWRRDDSVWRRLAAPAEASLDDLAWTILKAFKFDSDHGYDFCFRDASGRKTQAVCPDMDGRPYTTEITVGETGLRAHDEMLFTFDYGDS